MECCSKLKAPRAAFRAEVWTQSSAGQEPGHCVAPLGQGLCLQAKPGRQAAGEGDQDDQELLWPGMQTALARANAVGACPVDAAGQWIFLVWMSNVRRSAFQSLGELKHSPSLCVFSKRGITASHQHD